MPIEHDDVRFSTIAPAVLAGGRSRRFGRDKLREQFGGLPLVERPIAALRGIFGPRVAIVGDCEASVQIAGDLWIPDEHPGIGPMGGIATALRRLDRAVLVLAGDMPAIDTATVRRIAEGFLSSPAACVAMATAGDSEAVQRHPCVAVYAPTMGEVLEQAIRRERFSLLAAIDALDPAQVVQVPCDERRLTNINEPSDLSRLMRSA